MKTLSVTQPWATLIAIGAKRFETRSWNTRHRGLLAIHAAKRFPLAAVELCSQEPFVTALRSAGIERATDLPLGMIIATAFLKTTNAAEDTRLNLDTRELAFGFYDDRRFAWELIEIIALDPPIPARGALGLWNWDPLAPSVRQVAISRTMLPCENPARPNEITGS